MLTLPLNEIDKQEALRYMGCPGAPDASLLAVVSDCEEKLRRAVLPGVVYRVLPLCRENGVLSAGGMVLAGEDIARHLAECDRIILMAATLSGQADQLIHRVGISDMTRSLAMDALASAGIEQVCNRAEECFREQLPEVYFTWRFSPGYGDLPLALQPEILQSGADGDAGAYPHPPEVRDGDHRPGGSSAEKRRTGLCHLPDAGKLYVPQRRHTLLKLRKQLAAWTQIPVSILCYLELVFLRHTFSANPTETRTILKRSFSYGI